MSDRSEHLSPTILVVFGPTGDLMARKVVPSLFYLRGKGQLPEKLCVVGFGRREWGDAELRAHVRGILAERAAHADPADVEEFLALFEYQRGEFDDADVVPRDAAPRSRRDPGGVGRVLQQALLPRRAARATTRRSSATSPASGLTIECSDVTGWTRVLVEKPFGDDRDTARELDTLLGSLFREEQIYRIDHYLAKEMLQGIMNFRFTNNLFESEWNRAAIESIDITLLETIGAEKRGAFYDARRRAARRRARTTCCRCSRSSRWSSPRRTAPTTSATRAPRSSSRCAPMTPGEVADSTFRAQYEGFREIAGVVAGLATPRRTSSCARA